ncbi:MAG: HAD family hydrolase [Clostridia bacterium]|nr:HAD family hydrolase [Clostridia bacterium]
MEQKDMPGKSIWFDLDGTLLPMNLKTFTDGYFASLAGFLSCHGFEPKELIPKIWAATRAMMRNDGKRTNEAVFWEALNELYPERAPLNPAPFEEYYRTEFESVKRFCGFQPEAAALITELKRQGYFLVIATNPVFPLCAIEARLRWAGLEPASFDRITTYENSGFCKPFPGYYREILNACACSPEDCLMVGNDMEEDLPAAEVGANVFLIVDCLINPKKAPLEPVVHGPFSALLPWIRTNFS